LREVFRRGVAVLAVLCQAAIDEPAERRGNARVQAVDRLGRVLDYGGQRLNGRRALEGTLAGRHLVEDETEGELVGAEVERLPARLLGRHVACRAEDEAGPCHRLRKRRPLLAAPA